MQKIAVESVADLVRAAERQIQSFYYDRMLKSAKPKKMLAEGRRLPIPASSPVEVLKNPYVLELLADGGTTPPRD